MANDPKNILHDLLTNLIADHEMWDGMDYAPEREARIALERAHDVAHLAVDPRRQRGFGQPRPDRRGNIGGGRALGHFAHGTVGKLDLEHLGHGPST